jgi:hypothetical protein
MLWLGGQPDGTSLLLAVGENPANEVASCAVRMSQPDYADWRQARWLLDAIRSLFLGKGLTLPLGKACRLSKQPVQNGLALPYGFGFDKPKPMKQFASSRLALLGSSRWLSNTAWVGLVKSGFLH